MIQDLSCRERDTSLRTWPPRRAVLSKCCVEMLAIVWFTIISFVRCTQKLANFLRLQEALSASNEVLHVVGAKHIYFIKLCILLNVFSAVLTIRGYLRSKYVKGRGTKYYIRAMAQYRRFFCSAKCAWLSLWVSAQFLLQMGATMSVGRGDPASAWIFLCCFGGERFSQRDAGSRSNNSVVCKLWNSLFSACDALSHYAQAYVRLNARP